MTSEAPLLRIDGCVSPVEQRRTAEGLVSLASEPAAVRYHDDLAGTVACVWAEPPGPRARDVVQYLHGGYAMCSLTSHRRIAGHVACATDMRVLLVGYRLAPEHPFPPPSMTVSRCTAGCSIRQSSRSRWPGSRPVEASPWPPCSPSVTPVSRCPPRPQSCLRGST